jgi:osmotically inducible lipoprotein OsmB
MNTVMSGGNFKDFAIGFGVGMVAGYATGPLSGTLARGLGLNAAGIGTAALRGALSGSLAGAGVAAIYGGNVGMGALGGAIGGAAMGSLMWGMRSYQTEQFIKNNVEFDSSLSSSEKAALLQSIRESGQSPVGSRMIRNFRSAGAILSLASESVSPHGAGLGPHVTTGTNDMYFNGDVQGRFGQDFAGEPWGPSLNDATTLVHELGHTRSSGLAFGDPLNVAKSENLYRGWMGTPARKDYALTSRGQSSEPVPDRSPVEVFGQTW